MIIMMTFDPGHSISSSGTSEREVLNASNQHNKRDAWDMCTCSAAFASKRQRFPIRKKVYLRQCLAKRVCFGVVRFFARYYKISISLHVSSLSRNLHGMLPDLPKIKTVIH